MNRARRNLLVPFLLFCTARLGIAAHLFRPGYVDAAYCAVGAVGMAQSGGLCEVVIRNYLSDPADVPHLGLLCRMSRPCLLLAASMALLSTYTADEFLRLLFRPAVEFLRLRLPSFLTGWLFPVLSKPFIATTAHHTPAFPPGLGTRRRHWIVD